MKNFYRLRLNLKNIKYFKMRKQLRTYNEVVYITKESHPHFNIDEGSYNYILLQLMLNNIDVPKNVKTFSCEFIADLPIGKTDYTIGGKDVVTNVATIVLSRKMVHGVSRLILITAYFGRLVSNYYEKAANGQIGV